MEFRKMAMMTLYARPCMCIADFWTLWERERVG